MQALEIPPDATVFRSSGRVYYLYFGLNSLKILQKKWGLARLPGDSSKAYKAKCVALHERINDEHFDDMADIMHASLCHWAAQSGNGKGPVVLDDEQALRLFETADIPGRKGKFSAAGRFSALWTRFSLDRVGLGTDDSEETEDPKAPAPEASTPSDS